MYFKIFVANYEIGQPGFTIVREETLCEIVLKITLTNHNWYHTCILIWVECVSSLFISSAICGNYTRKVRVVLNHYIHSKINCFTKVPIQHLKIRSAILAPYFRISLKSSAERNVECTLYNS